MQGDAHPLPAIFHAQDRTRQRSAKAQIYLAGGCFEEAIRLRRGKKIDDRLNSYCHRLLEWLLELHVDLASQFTTIGRRAERVLLDEQQLWCRCFRLAMQSHRVRTEKLGIVRIGILHSKRATGKTSILL